MHTSARDFCNIHKAKSACGRMRGSLDGRVVAKSGDIVTGELARLQHCGWPMLAVGSCHVGKESHSLAVHFDRHRCIGRNGVVCVRMCGDPCAGAQVCANV